MENYLKMSLTLNKNDANSSTNQGQAADIKTNLTKGSVDSTKKSKTPYQNTKTRYRNSYMQAFQDKVNYEQEASNNNITNTSRTSLNKSNISLNKSVGQSASTSNLLKTGTKTTTSMKNLKPSANIAKPDLRRSVSNVSQPVKKFIKKLSKSKDFQDLKASQPIERYDTQDSQPSNILDTSKLKDENQFHLQESMTISLSPVTKAKNVNYDEFKTNGEIEDLVNFKKLVDSKMEPNIDFQKTMPNNEVQEITTSKEIMKTSDSFKNTKTNTSATNLSTTPVKRNSYASTMAAIAKAEKNLKNPSGKGLNIANTVNSMNNSVTKLESTVTPTTKTSTSLIKKNSIINTLTNATTNNSSVGTAAAKNNLKPKTPQQANVFLSPTKKENEKSAIQEKPAEEKPQKQSPIKTVQVELNENKYSNENIKNINTENIIIDKENKEMDDLTSLTSTIKLTSPKNYDFNQQVNISSPNNLRTSTKSPPSVLREPEKERLMRISTVSPSRNKEEFVIEMNEPKDSISMNQTEPFIFNTSPQIHLTAETTDKNPQEEIDSSNSSPHSGNRISPKKNTIEIEKEDKIIQEVTETSELNQMMEEQEHVEVEHMHLTSERQDLSQIDEVLSNISHNLTSRDIFPHRDSIPKNIILVSTSENCFSVNSNKDTKDKTHTQIKDLSVNIENSILIPGTQTEIISEPLELNHSVKFSIDPAYSKARFQFNQNLFDESKMEISIPILIRKKSPYKKSKEVDVEISAKEVNISPLEISRMDVTLVKKEAEKKDQRLLRTSKSLETNQARDMFLISNHKRNSQKHKVDVSPKRGRLEKGVYISPVKSQNVKNKIDSSSGFSISQQKKKDFPIATQILSKKIDRPEHMQIQILPVRKSPEKKLRKEAELEIRAIPIVPLIAIPKPIDKIEHQEIEIIGSPKDTKISVSIKPANTHNEPAVDLATLDRSLAMMLNKIKSKVEKNKEKSIDVYSNDTIESHRKGLEKGDRGERADRPDRAERAERSSPWSTNTNFNPNPSRNNIQEKLDKLSTGKSRSPSRSRSKDKFASFNKISKNKIDLLRENLDISNNREQEESQEKKFRDKVDSVKNRLQLVSDEKFKYNYQTMFPNKKSDDLRININTLNSLSNPRRDISPDEDFSDIVLPDEIISELQEKYFGKMEFIDRRKLVKFYKKYINKESSKGNKLHSLDTLESRKLSSNFMMKQEEADNQKNIKKLREMLNLKEEPSNPISNYMVHKPNKSSLNTEVASAIKSSSVYDVNLARKKYLTSNKNDINFGIMPTNAIDPNSIKFRSNLPKKLN